MRFRLLETLREFAQEQLSPVQRVECEQRHLAYFAHLAEQAAPHLNGPEQARWLERLNREHANIRAAFAAAPHSPESEMAGLRLVTALWRYWEMRGHYSEGRERYAAMLALPTAQIATKQRAMALNAAANLAYHQRDLEEARLDYEASLDICRQLDDKQRMSVALGNLGNLASDRGEYAQARTLYGEALALKREMGSSPVNLAITLSNLGNVHLREQDYAGAYALYREALSLHEGAGNLGGQLIVHVTMGAAALMEGGMEAARISYHAALRLCREVDEHLWTAMALEGMARIACRQADGNQDTLAVSSLRRGHRAAGHYQHADRCGGLGRPRKRPGRSARPAWRRRVSFGVAGRARSDRA